MPDRDDAEVAQGPSLDAFRGASRVERALLPFLREPTLWPVLGAVLVHVVALVAPVMVIVWRDPVPGWPLVGVSTLALLSAGGIATELREHRRLGPLCGLIAATWTLCGSAAWAGARIGIL